MGYFTSIMEVLTNVLKYRSQLISEVSRKETGLPEYSAMETRLYKTIMTLTCEIRYKQKNKYVVDPFATSLHNFLQLALIQNLFW